LKFPVFVKPYDGSRSQGIFLFKAKEEVLEEVLENKKNMFLEYLDQNTHDEYTIDMYFNKKGKLITIVPRQRLEVRDGEVNKGCTRKNKIISFVKTRFKNITGLVGCITLQVFMHKHEEENITGIEVNPRFGGGYPLSYLAGANFPKWIIEEYILNTNVDEYNEDWEENLLMLRYDHEVLVHGFIN